ncbi:hypothetical protein L484_012844 [Morus notabilis]|uniref:Uncharacterized protein n=1 Tax=Morus notabilis TaxID=981085 RepID=W9R2R8_9ROSA|nr:hypothetical protein L484_012844 [Morus notabilis]
MGRRRRFEASHGVVRMEAIQGWADRGDSGLGGRKRLSRGWWDGQGAGRTRRSATIVGYEDLTVG